MLPDFLTGSPLKLHDKDKGDRKKDKKHGMFHIGSPLKRSKEKESPKSDKKGGGDAAGAGSFQESDQGLKSASKREEAERLRRLQLQEEQDLAYAIALSKAEAASLNQQQQ
jgi:hypothetical protein